MPEREATMDDLKPEFVAADPYKSRKWDELTAGSDIEPAAVPTLTLLVNWYAILDQCMRDISADDGTHVAYVNDQGDVKAMPQIATMKQASAEIRALNKQLFADGGDAALIRRDAKAMQRDNPLERARRARELRLEVRNGGKAQRKAAT